MNFGGVLLSALIGGIGWVLFAFVGAPIRKFWDLRGEVLHAMNQYARNISEAPDNTWLLFGQTSGTHREEAAAEFRRLALELTKFWKNETLARLFLRAFGMSGEAAAKMLFELSEANVATNRLGPRRSELAATLRLKP